MFYYFFNRMNKNKDIITKTLSLVQEIKEGHEYE